MDVDLLKNIAEDVKNFEINMNSFFSYSSDWALVGNPGLIFKTFNL